MNDKYLFSIIIPVYNAEKTIMRTLQSLLLQTGFVE
ncbi:glycosyltransferase [Pantoea stewartii]